jgi:hypothetical protein
LGVGVPQNQWKKLMTPPRERVRDQVQLKRFREKSLSISDARQRGTLCLVVPHQICRDYSWIWDMKGYYDYDKEKENITRIHQLSS